MANHKPPVPPAFRALAEAIGWQVTQPEDSDTDAVLVSGKDRIPINFVTDSEVKNGSRQPPKP